MLHDHLNSRLLSMLKQHPLKEKRDFILGHAEPFVNIVVEEEENYETTGNSRIAGYPDLPPRLEWPSVDDDHYYTFIAQFNMSELPAEILDFFPKHGMLYFFLGSDDSASDIDHRIFYYDGDLSHLKKTFPPEGKEEISSGDRNFTGVKIFFEPGVTVKFDSDLGDYLSEHDEELYSKFYHHYDTIWGQYESFTEDHSLDAYFCRNGLQRLMYQYYRTEEQIREEAQNMREMGHECYAQELEEALPLLNQYKNNESFYQQQAEDWHQLFKLSSLDEACMCWWDVGFLQFYISKKDLEKRIFSNTYACIESS
ncbi:YwqG family protein [Brevibacillus fortis]|uniref:YwqG family protein n=1 Tax=Brevibacillus fortis TaxID=2126352 RepID=UPI002E1A4B12|nr:YwqG family protein [Brevibacillus fortis]